MTAAYLNDDDDTPEQMTWSQAIEKIGGMTQGKYNTAAKTEPTGIEALVCKDIAARQALGINKYGTTVADNPLAVRAWLEHAYQECLDQAVYLRRAMEELPE